jgi:hypothetical protein
VNVQRNLSVLGKGFFGQEVYTTSSILTTGTLSTLGNVNITSSLSVLQRGFFAQEVYTTSSILTTGTFSTLEDVNVRRNVSILGTLYVLGNVQFDDKVFDAQDILASSILTRFAISSMSASTAGTYLNVLGSTMLTGTVSTFSNVNIAGFLSTLSTAVIGHSLKVNYDSFFGSTVSTPSSMGVGGTLGVAGHTVLYSTFSTMGQAAFFSSMQLGGSMSIFSSLAVCCNIDLGGTLSTSNIRVTGSTFISTLAVTNTIGFGFNVSSSTMHYGLFSTLGAMNVGGLFSTTNALTVGSTIDTRFLRVQANMSVFSNAGFAQDIFARSTVTIGMSTILHGGFYTQKSAYMADAAFIGNVVIGNNNGVITGSNQIIIGSSTKTNTI